MSSNSDQELVCGLNAVSQIISSRPKSVKSLHVGEALNTRIESIVEEAEKNKIKIKKEDPEFFEKKFRLFFGHTFDYLKVIVNTR